MSNRGDQLAARLLRGESDLANELLDEFFSGYPVANLRPLLASVDETVAKAATWIASELGERASPILDAVIPMLEHESRYVKFFAIDVVLVCATREHGQAVAAAIGLLLDGDEAVRWKSLVFVSKASQSQLVDSLAYQRSSTLRSLTSWLVDSDKAGCEAVGCVTTRLLDDLPLVRQFAAAAAVRLLPVAPVLLKRAAESGDATVASFASEQLRLLR